MANIALKKQTEYKKLPFQTIRIDGAGQQLGRLASKVAMILMGKHKAGVSGHLDGHDSVVIFNAKQIKFSGKKIAQKVYKHHTNYPGGLREYPLSKAWEKRPTWVIKEAIKQMLPKNTLRPNRLKHLTIEL